MVPSHRRPVPNQTILQTLMIALFVEMRHVLMGRDLKLKAILEGTGLG